MQMTLTALPSAMLPTFMWSATICCGRCALIHVFQVARLFTVPASFARQPETDTIPPLGSHLMTAPLLSLSPQPQPIVNQQTAGCQRRFLHESEFPIYVCMMVRAHTGRHCRQFHEAKQVKCIVATFESPCHICHQTKQQVASEHHAASACRHMMHKGC